MLPQGVGSPILHVNFIAAVCDLTGNAHFAAIPRKILGSQWPRHVEYVTVQESYRTHDF